MTNLVSLLYRKGLQMVRRAAYYIKSYKLPKDPQKRDYIIVTGLSLFKLVLTIILVVWKLLRMLKRND